MILACSLPLIAAKVTIEWTTVGFKDVFVRHQHLLALVECLLVNMPVLILDGVDFAPLHLAFGLEELPDSRERTGAPVLWLSCEGQMDVWEMCSVNFLF